MAALIASNLPAIFRTIETKLTTYVSPITGLPVAGDISNIYWVLTGDEPEPGTTGQRDILLIERGDDTEGSVVGAGRFAWINSGLDVNLRSSYVADRRSSKKDWLTVHRLLIDALMDSLMGFFPIDGQNNALTIEGLVLDVNATPAKNRESATWGETVATYRFHYMPNIDTSIL